LSFHLLSYFVDLYSVFQKNGGDICLTTVISVSTNKGGVLKTTTVSNLAAVLAKRGKRVLIIDTDNQGNTALSFGVNPDKLIYTVYDLIMSNATAQEMIIPLEERIDLIPANDDMTFLEHDLWRTWKKDETPHRLLRDAIKPVISSYDYVLIDTAPNLGIATGNALVASDSVLIPFQPESYSMRSLSKIIRAITDYREHNPALTILGVVATLVDSRTNLHSTVLQECRKFCMSHDVRLFETAIPRTVRFANSIAYFGQPVSLLEDTVYDELAKEIGWIS
jgi:chromosome partitioning protein